MMLIRKEIEYCTYFLFCTMRTLYNSVCGHTHNSVTHGIGKKSLYNYFKRTFKIIIQSSVVFEQSSTVHCNGKAYFYFFLKNSFIFGFAGSLGFPGGSVGKEFDCNAGDPGSIPGSGGFAGEGIGYPLQYSWVSLVAQLEKNLLAMWEIWIRSLGWEDLLEKGKTTHPTILAWRIPWTVHGVPKSRT